MICSYTRRLGLGNAAWRARTLWRLSAAMVAALQYTSSGAGGEWSAQNQCRTDPGHFIHFHRLIGHVAKFLQHWRHKCGLNSASARKGALHTLHQELVIDNLMKWKCQFRRLPYSTVTFFKIRRSEWIVHFSRSYVLPPAFSNMYQRIYTAFLLNWSWGWNGAPSSLY